MQKQYIKSRRKDQKREMLTYKGGSCQLCNYAICARAMDFHHKDPTQKDFGICGMNKSWEEIKTELDKCILVCKNCHGEIHDGLHDQFKILNVKVRSNYANRIYYYRKQFKHNLVQYAGGYCAICTYKKSYRCLSFHHLNKSTKTFEINEATQKTLEEIAVELDKCILLCLNCHSEVHDEISDISDVKPIKNLEYLDIIKSLIQKDEKPLIIEKYYCLDCNVEKKTSAARCVPCSQKYQEKVKWPEIEELIEMLKTSNKVLLAKQLGVSEAAIRKRLSKYMFNT